MDYPPLHACSSGYMHFSIFSFGNIEWFFSDNKTTYHWNGLRKETIWMKYPVLFSAKNNETVFFLNIVCFYLLPAWWNLSFQPL